MDYGGAMTCVPGGSHWGDASGDDDDDGDSIVVDSDDSSRKSGRRSGARVRRPRQRSHRAGAATAVETDGHRVSAPDDGTVYGAEGMEPLVADRRHGRRGVDWHRGG